MYQGHLPDGSSVQRHSAGGLYPFVMLARQRGEELVHGFLKPSGEEVLVGSYNLAHLAAEAQLEYWRSRGGK